MSPAIPEGVSDFSLNPNRSYFMFGCVYRFSCSQTIRSTVVKNDRYMTGFSNKPLKTHAQKNLFNPCMETTVTKSLLHILGRLAWPISSCI